jgi:hypothetical protein
MIGRTARARCLHGQESRNPIDETEARRFIERLTKGGSVPEVAGGQGDPIRRFPIQLLQELENDRFLPSMRNGFTELSR